MIFSGGKNHLYHLSARIEHAHLKLLTFVSERQRVFWSLSIITLCFYRNIPLCVEDCEIFEWKPAKCLHWQRCPLCLRQDALRRRTFSLADKQICLMTKLIRWQLGMRHISVLPFVFFWQENGRNRRRLFSTCVTFSQRGYNFGILNFARKSRNKIQVLMLVCSLIQNTQ